MLGSDSSVPIIASQNSVLVTEYSVSCLAEEPHREDREHRAGLAQDAVELLVEFQDVERPPEIAVADRRRRAEREDDDGGVEDRHPRLVIEIARDEHQHGADHAHRDHEDDLLRVGHAAERKRQHGGAEHEPAAEDAPVDRRAARLFPRGSAPRRSARSAGSPARSGTPSRAKTDRPARPTIRRPPAMPTDSDSRPSTCTMPSSAAHFRRPAWARRSRVDARHHFGRHRIRDHVLDDGAEHDQQRAEHIELVRRQEGEPAAGGARERDQPGRR